MLNGRVKNEEEKSVVGNVSSTAQLLMVAILYYLLNAAELSKQSRCRYYT